MTSDLARKWLILFSLGIAGAQFLFFLLAPNFGYPLQFGEALRMLEIVSPVFLGYLGTATQFLFHPAASAESGNLNTQLLNLLVKGPTIIFGTITVAALFSFGYANRSGGPGMVPDTLGLMLAGNLGLLTVTTNIIVANLFPSTAKPNEEKV